MNPRTILTCILLTALTGAASAQEPLSSPAAETIDVELKTVPFYAVDADGQPVYDLALEELEIRVDGVLASPDTLDRWTTGDVPVSTEPSPATATGRPARPARQVFLLVDEALSSKDAWQRGRRLAVELVDRLPASDHLHLLVHDSVSGLRYLAGPARDAAERQRLRETVAALKPGAHFLRARLERTGLPPLLGVSGGSGVGAQEKTVYEAAGRLARSEFQATAVSLAGGFETLAASFERITAPKLLVVFSSGIESDFYFDGTYGFGIGSNGLPTYHGRMPRLAPINGAYERSLALLAGAGVVPIFVNPESSRAVGSDSLNHMSQSTGGLFLDGGKLETLQGQIVAASSAYYEAGFYLHEQPALEEPARIEIAVRRPGVRVIFPNRLRNRQEYSALNEAQKQFVIVDLVRRGAPSANLTTLHPLDGALLRHSGGKPRVAFDAAWPETVRGKAVDLYDVALEIADGETRLVRFDRRQLEGAAEPLRVETPLPRGTTLVWGIVAVEPASGTAFLRRLRLEPES